MGWERWIGNGELWTLRKEDDSMRNFKQLRRDG